MIAVSNTSPIINLAAIGKLDLLRKHLGEIIIPRAVHDEIDETDARKVASNLGLRFIGLLGLLVKAKEKGYIKKVKPLMDRLKGEAGFWIEDNLYQYVLNTVRE